jgi:hypothetical protein
VVQCKKPMRSIPGTRSVTPKPIFRRPGLDADNACNVVVMTQGQHMSRSQKQSGWFAIATNVNATVGSLPTRIASRDTAGDLTWIGHGERPKQPW